MGSNPFHFTRWLHGATLVSEPDQINDDALRRATNVRLDRVLGAITPRPGWSAKNATLGAIIRFLSRLFGGANTYNYAQVNTTLYRTAADWSTPTSILAVTSQVLSDANSPDGNGHILKYLVNGSIARKDDGTTLSIMGIAPPTAAPSAVALATDLMRTIDTMDVAANWTGSNLASGPSNDTSIWAAAGRQAFADIGSGTNGTVTTTVDVAGVAGNAYTITVVLGVGLNVAMTAGIVGTVITVTLGTDGTGALDPTKNTATLVAAAITALAGVTAAASGTGVSSLTVAEGPTTFDGGNDTSAVTFTIAASTFGSIAKFTAADINLDTLLYGDNLVKDDDYIHLWVRLDRPERVTYLQIDIDIDSGTTGVADAFRHTYYTVRLPALTRLYQGTNGWTKVQVRKSEFSRLGTDTSRTWAHAQAFRIGFLTNSQGTVTVHLDDFQLRGGVGIEGEITYTVCYRNSTTMGRGNPPKDSDGVVLYTSTLLVDRQRVNITLTNVLQGGTNHPGDSQIDTLMIWRKGGIFTTAVLVDSISDTSQSPYLDNTSDATLILTNKLLETDNDMPPTGSTRVLFGPDATGHFFMIVDGYRLYISKPYEDDENRVENWPASGFAIIGDGSTRALAGLAKGAQVTTWTTALTYNVIGVGQDTFLPVFLEGSRGIVSQFAYATGENADFFVSQDGIYEKRGLTESKLTGAIDPFFQGRTIDGQLGWNTNDTAMALVRLAFLAEPTGACLVMAYADSTSSTLNCTLTLKPNLQDGRLTEVFFDQSNQTTIQSLFSDTVTRELLAGGNNGVVYRIEDASVYTDAGVGMTILARSKSTDLGQPQRQKQIAQVSVEGHTAAQPLTVSAYYDRQIGSEAVGTLNTASEVGIQQFPTATPTNEHRDVAVEVTGPISARVVITRMGVFARPLPEATVFRDSGDISYDQTHQLKRLRLDIDARSDVTLTLFLDGLPTYTTTLFHTAGRKVLHIAVPAGLRARVFRVTIGVTVVGDSAFLVYSVKALTRIVGIEQDYAERDWIEGV